MMPNHGERIFHHIVVKYRAMIAAMLDRSVQSKLLAALNDTPALIVHGARQTGKTTLAKLATGKSGRKYAYFNLDDLETRSLASRDPGGFVAGLPEHVILDEIQLAPETFRAIKQSIDDNRKPGRFVLTGSANVLLIPQLANALVGRVELHALFPFSQSEIEGTPGRLIDLAFGEGFRSVSGQQFPFTKPDLVSRIVAGGYPEVVTRRKNGRRTEWFNGYVSTVIQRDIRDLADIEGLAMLPRTLGLLATRVANLSNLSELSRTLGVPHTTLKRYLALFDATFLTQTIPAWSGNLSKRLVKAAKIMAIDTGLLCHLLGVDEQRLIQDPNLLGPVLENFAYTEILKQTTWANTDVRIMHFRTHGNQEVDLVLERRDGSLFGIEVKSTATPTARDFAGLEFLRQELGARFVGGVLLCLGSQVIPVSDRVYAAPMSMLWQV
jgi:uncharacterized protein